MKKKILTLCLTFLLTILFICKTIPVKASENASTSTFIDTGITTTIPDSIKGNGCYLSLYDFCLNNEYLLSFLRLEFPDELNTVLRLQKGIEKGYFDEKLKPSIVYITSEELFNTWLRSHMYISRYDTYKEGLGGYYGENGVFINLGAYNALHELLQSEEEVKAYILKPEEVPDIYYDEYEIIDSAFAKYYKFSETRLPYIINGTWQYKAIEYDGPVEKCKVLDLPNSVGKVKQMTLNTYQYIYSEVLFDNSLGYYSLNQDEMKTIELSKEELPSFVFDTSGNIKDIYISKQDDLWTLPEIKNVKKQIEYHYRIRREFYYTSFRGSSDSGDDFYLFVAYMNFEVPIDTIEEIKLTYRYWDVTQRYNPFKAIGWVSYKIDEATCTIYHDTKVVDPFSKKGKDGSYGYTNAITKSDYYVSSTHYTFRVCLSDDNFVPKSYAENDYYTSYTLEYEPVSELQVVNLIFSYQSILYNSKNLYGFSDDPDNNPNHENSLWQKFWEWIVKLWNLGIFGEILVIIIFALFSIPCIYLLSFIVKLIRKLIVNKKNKSTS